VDASLQARADSLFSERYDSVACRTDRMFAALFLLQYLGCIAGALLLSPQTWVGGSSEVHVHVISAVGVGGLLLSLPLYLVVTRPGCASTRYVIAGAQMLFSALLIHVTGGRIETHFHVFGSLAFLAFYRDWRVFLPATLVVCVDHIARGAIWPESIYGVSAASHWRWVEHAAWVVFEAGFLTVSCIRSEAEMRSLAESQAVREGSQEERYRGLYDEAPVAYLTVSPAGRITSANARASQLLGERVGLGDMCLEELLEPRPELVEQAALLSQILIAPGGSIEQVHVIETRLRSETPEELWVRMTIVREVGSEGVVRESRVLLEDVSARKLATLELEETSAKLREASWRAGMAEVASNVLHNVGNVLNSVNTSVGVLVEGSEGSRVSDLKRASLLLREHAQDLPAFAASKQGRALPEFLTQLTSTLEEERRRHRGELKHLQESVAHIHDIIASQQATAAVGAVEELVALDDLVREAIALAEEESGLKPVCDLDSPEPIVLDRCKVTQILVNLIRNGWDAMEEVPRAERRLEIKTRASRGSHRVEVRDAGCGIAPEDLVKIFGHGYTTKPKGNGFGLHSAANSAKEFGGDLVAESAGLGQGTCFTLTLLSREVMA